MAIVIRTLFNNQNWKGPCKNPHQDQRCDICFQKPPPVNIVPPPPDDPVDEDGFCKGGCWEQRLCIDYKWGCTPEGRKFSKRANIGVKAFFVYRQPNHEYTLWGKSKVRDVNVLGHDGFYYLYFEPFEPLPEHKWVPNLAADKLVGEQWLMGNYRFIDDNREVYLEGLIQGGKQSKIIFPSSLGDYVELNVRIKPNIKEGLEVVANKEGRPIEEIVREAIAELLRARGYL